MPKSLFDFYDFNQLSDLMLSRLNTLSSDSIINEKFDSFWSCIFSVYFEKMKTHLKTFY